MRKLRSLHERLKHLKTYNNFNLHRIAISNLSNTERQLVRWWCKKYGVPHKPLEEYTIEELMIEQLEDFYDQHPVEIERFYAQEHVDYNWNGKMPNQYELAIKARLDKINARNKVNIKKYQDERPLTPEEEKAILDNLGRNLPGSKRAASLANNPKNAEKVETLGSGEFDEEFGGA